MCIYNVTDNYGIPLRFKERHRRTKDFASKFDHLVPYQSFFCIILKLQ